MLLLSENVPSHMKTKPPVEPVAFREAETVVDVIVTEDSAKQIRPAACVYVPLVMLVVI